MPLTELGRRLSEQTPQGRLSKWEINLKNISNPRNTTNTLARRVKNMRIRFAKSTSKSVSTSWEIENRLFLNLSTRATSFKVKKSFTMMMPVPSTLPFLSSPKVTYFLCDRGVRLENHFLSPVMCPEQPNSMSHMFSKPPSITYIGREEVDGSVVGLVR
jgi:hypothetical protein